jgi:hypothetical protein
MTLFAIILTFSIAKSNVVNRNRATAGSPPQQDNMNKIMDWGAGTASHKIIQDIEYFARNFAALGQCVFYHLHATRQQH